MSSLEKNPPSTNDSPQQYEGGLDAESSGALESAVIKPVVTEDMPMHTLKPLSWLLVVLALLAALFLFALDNTIVANVQENIIYTLGGIDKLPWISVAFALGAVATNLFWYVITHCTCGL